MSFNSYPLYVKHSKDIFVYTPHDIYGIKIDIEGSEIGLLENITQIPTTLQCLVIEWSFDFCPDLYRFRKVVERLKTWFTVEHRNINTMEKKYEFYPPCILIFCARKIMRPKYDPNSRYMDRVISLLTQLEHKLVTTKLPKSQRSIYLCKNQHAAVFGWATVLAVEGG